MESTVEVRKEDCQLKHPFNALFSGPSQCGKTSLLRSVLENHNQTISGLNKDIINVIWCYGKWQKYYNEPLYNVNFKYFLEMPDEEDVKGYDIIVLDDLMHKINKSVFIGKLFTAGTHHDNQSVFVLTQDYFFPGEIPRTLRKIAHYTVLFNDPGDSTPIRTISWRMFTENSKYIISAFRMATSEPFGYLLIDRKQLTKANCRIRTRIVPTEETDFQLRPIGFTI